MEAQSGVARFNAENLESLAKALAFATASLYVLGLLSVNGYLLTLGVSDFTLVRVRFIYTGALEAFLFVASYFFPILLFRGTRDIHFKGRSSRVNIVGAVVVTILALAFSCVLLLMAFFASDNALSLGDAAWRSSKVVLAAFIIGAVIESMISADQAMNKRAFGLDVPATVRLGDFSVYGSLALLGAVAFIVTFMSVAYPQIPVQLGGGGVQKTQLLIKGDSLESAKQLKLLPSNTKTALTEPVNVIYEGSEDYIIRLSEGSTITLKKELVAATIRTH